jgi:hypothetical protein
MKQGGNAQIRRFFKKLAIENSPLQTLYCTKAAEHYREKLRERVGKVLSGELVSEKRSHSEKAKLQHPASPLLPVPPSKTITANVIYARFNAGPMGMTLTKDFREQAYVSKLLPGGQAQQQGIKLGDIVIAVAGKTMASYDEIMHMIPLMPRPLELNLTRVEASPSKAEPIHHSLSDTALVTMNKVPHGVSVPLAVPAIRGTKIAETFLASDLKAKPNHTAVHPMKQGTKLLKLLRKGMNPVGIGFEDDSESDNNNTDELDDDDNEDIPEGTDNDTDVEPAADEDQTNSEKIGSHQNYEKLNISPIKVTAAHDTGKTRNPLESGSVIKVLKTDSGKWKTAMIKRRHKDNTFKVIFKDGSEESHVSISRLAIVSGASTRQQTVPSPSTREDLHANGMAKMESALTESSNTSKGGEVSNSSNFVVEAEENLDAWIEKDFQYDFSMTQLSEKDSFFVPKDNTAPSIPGKDREVKGINSGDLIVDFVAPPLGLTLSTNSHNEAEVIRLRSDGTAVKEGVQIGDVVVFINGTQIHGHEEAMQVIGAAIYPLSISFRRSAKGIVAESSEVLMRNSKMIANQLMDTMGLSKDSILSSSKTTRLANSRANGNSTNSPSSLHPTIRARLNVNPGPSQFDVHFDQEDLGFRVQERIGAQIVSVVTEVIDKGEANSKGVSIGCVIVGINFEPYLSHAHTVATLKYSKPPVVIRFMK